MHTPGLKQVAEKAVITGERLEEEK